MTLSDFETFIRLYVPGAKTSVVPQTTLHTLINRGVNEVNSRGRILDQNKTFNVTAEKQEYDIVSDVANDFLTMDKSGLWWNQGTSASPDWKQLDPVTREYLDENEPNWHNRASGSPKCYYVTKTKIGIHPKPDTTLSDGFWLFYIEVANDMTVSTHYPFTGTTTEMTTLRDLDDPIIDYVRWKLARPLGKTEKGVISREEYETTVDEMVGRTRRRIDLDNHHTVSLRGASYK